MGGEIIAFASACTLVLLAAVRLMLSLPSLFALTFVILLRLAGFTSCCASGSVLFFRGALAVPGGPSSSAVPARRGPCLGLRSANLLAGRQVPIAVRCLRASSAALARSLDLRSAVFSASPAPCVRALLLLLANGSVYFFSVGCCKGPWQTAQLLQHLQLLRGLLQRL